MATENKSTASTIGLKNVVIAPLTEDTEATITYGDLVPVAGAIEATLSPENTDADVQYADDAEYDVVYPDPEVTLTTKMADIPLNIQAMIFSNKLDQNGVLLRGAGDKPGYFALGFKSEKSDHTFRYVWLFKVRATPMEESYATKEGATITRQNGEVKWTAIKRVHDDFYQAIADEGLNGFTEDKGKTFLSSVYQPSLPTS